MKKNICSQGIENIMPNQSKKPGSARSRKILSLKTKTQNSELESEFPRKIELDPNELNSKLKLIEKYQEDVQEEVKLLDL